VLFRTLVLMGIIAFAVVSAIGKILTAVQGGVIPAVQLDGLGWYFSAMVLLNLWLWRVFARSWSNGGGNNDMLRGMAISARFDALISAGTGIALLGSPSLLATPLAPLVPIADSLLVLVLSLALVGEPIAILQGAVTEAAGSSRSIPQGLHSSCSAAVAAVLAERGCTLLELAMIRLGRTVTAVAYVEPATAVTASQTDGLRLDVEAELVQTLQTPVLCEVIATSVHPYAEPAN
jgi:predicted Co/Zn/Cd cation transporter (cation efflux family)